MRAATDCCPDDRAGVRASTTWTTMATSTLWFSTPGENRQSFATTRKRAIIGSKSNFAAPERTATAWEPTFASFRATSSSLRKSTAAAAIKATSARGSISAWASGDRVDRVEVRWIGGGVDVFENLPVNRLVTLVEGFGRKVTPWPASCDASAPVKHRPHVSGLNRVDRS